LVNAKVVSIDERRRGYRVEADIERARRALGVRFGDLEALEVRGNVERYLAREGAGQPVELKVLSAPASGNASARELFYLETYAASKLDHVNIVATGKPEQLSGVDFCVVETRPDARTLRALLDRDGWLDVKAAAAVADQIASALDHAHKQGVLHLRLQPECILIEPDGWVMVADFGIDIRRGTQSRRRPNTPYASPEQNAGGQVDPCSDLYSLGAVLYEMLTDRTPFDSNDSEYVRQKQAAALPAPPHMIFAGVPESVSGVVMRLLETEPAKRLGNAAAFQAAIYDAAQR
jgi:serine/threonine-protein kinase